MHRYVRSLVSRLVPQLQADVRFGETEEPGMPAKRAGMTTPT